MNKNIAQEIQTKTAKLLEIKKRYNELVKAVDEEFSEQINQFNEKKIHVPLDIAKPILQALMQKNIKSEDFKEYVQQFSELISFMSDSEAESESDHHYSLNRNSENLEIESHLEDISENDPLIQSIQSNKSEFVEEEAEEDILISGDGNSDDSLVQLDDVKLDMDQFVKQNFDVQESFDGF